MNFFGHVTIAVRESNDTDLLFGSMLPDLSSMARMPTPTARPGSLSRGIALHHATDAMFHGLPEFVSLCGWAVEELTAVGIGRAAARAVGHVGSELLLDGVLAEDRNALDAYRASLAHAADTLGALGLDYRVPDGAMRLEVLLARLSEAPVPIAYTEPAFVADRLERILAPRKRLALRPDDREAVQRWLEHALPRINADLRPAVRRLDLREN